MRQADAVVARGADGRPGLGHEAVGEARQATAERRRRASADLRDHGRVPLDRRVHRGGGLRFGKQRDRDRSCPGHGLRRARDQPAELRQLGREMREGAQEARLRDRADIGQDDGYGSGNISAIKAFGEDLRQAREGGLGQAAQAEHPRLARQLVGHGGRDRRAAAAGRPRQADRPPRFGDQDPDPPDQRVAADGAGRPDGLAAARADRAGAAWREGISGCREHRGAFRFGPPLAVPKQSVGRG
ncbi:hypothetical protein FV227_20320 [Methylobacterium sp. WL119]|uniref:hypothetical protein n=1 Tax=Methylobacterium sp. WL119 TaxID=2603888 RepID=UPI0011CAF205|nr:hypothetical protein [Methylobacterium sp. WL119]TXN48309.1 hypothetical protein FV227_20320 [Methylobacterium sp. WL119]